MDGILQALLLLHWFVYLSFRKKRLLHVKFLQSNSLSSLSCWEAEGDQVTDSY